MVKGISRQVIVVHSPNPKLFEQAIFILKDDASHAGISDEMLLKEAQNAIHTHSSPNTGKRLCLFGMVCACCGALLTVGVWVITTIL